MYINLYHDAISERLNKIISRGLEDQEDVTVLHWIIQVKVMRVELDALQSCFFKETLRVPKVDVYDNFL